jgi:hypothetical protein
MINGGYGHLIRAKHGYIFLY